MNLSHLFRKIACLTTASLLTLNLAAFGVDQIYIKNRPFKGSVSTVSGQVWVELPAFAKAIGATLVSNEQGGHVLSLSQVAAEAAKEVPANTVMVSGNPIEVRSNAGTLEVPLEVTAKALNAKVIANKSMGTVDVNLGGPVQAAAAPSLAAKPDPKAQAASSNILRVTGKVTLEGANAVGLFEGGSATVPYKTGKVDSKGNYVMEIDLTKDLHGGLTDMRFYQEGGFEYCHGRCNFIRYNPETKTAVLSPYGTNQEFTSQNGQLNYTEPNE
jgi:hypothetical protein